MYGCQYIPGSSGTRHSKCENALARLKKVIKILPTLTAQQSSVCLLDVGLVVHNLAPDLEVFVARDVNAFSSAGLLRLLVVELAV